MRPYFSGVSAFFVGALLIFAAVRWLSIDAALLNIDEAAYAAAAVRSIETQTPILKASRDNKPPGIHAVYAGTFVAFGNYNMLALRWVALAWVLATAAVLLVCARRWFGGASGLAAAAFYLLATSLDLRFVALKTEVLANLPLAIAVGVLIEAVVRRDSRWAFGAGLFAGLSMAFRQPSVLIMAGAMAGCVYAQLRSLGWTWRAPAALLLSATLGIAAAFAAIGAYFWQAGALAELILQTFRLPADFATVDRFTLPQRAMRFATYIDEYSRYGPLLFAWAAVGLVLCGHAALAPRKALESANVAPPTIIGASIGAALAFAAAPDMFHAYFVQLFVPLAFAFAFATMVLCGEAYRETLRIEYQIGFVALTFIAWTSAAVVALKEPLKLALGQSTTQDRPLAPLVARMAATSKPGDKLFVWGFRPQLYVASRLAPATRFTLTDVVVGASGDVGRTLDSNGVHAFYEPGGWQALMEELDRERPRFIVDARYMAIQTEARPLSEFPLLARYIQRHYDLAATLGPNLTLYERRDGGSADR